MKQYQLIRVQPNVTIVDPLHDGIHHIIVMMYLLLLEQHVLDRLVVAPNPKQHQLIQHQVDSIRHDKCQFYYRKHSTKKIQNTKYNRIRKKYGPAAIELLNCKTFSICFFITKLICFAINYLLLFNDFQHHFIELV